MGARSWALPVPTSVLIYLSPLTQKPLLPHLTPVCVSLKTVPEPGAAVVRCSAHLAGKAEPAWKLPQ